MSYIFEDGKKFWQTGDGFLERCHYGDFNGARFRHKRCPFCNRITSVHILHWMNHLLKCQGEQKLHPDTIADLRYHGLDDIPEYKLKDSSWHSIYQNKLTK
jgi:hypothetical protein